jgi:hypothetical protein
MDAMITGYAKPLYILPFDHRHSYITGMFHWQEPLAPDQVADIVASKQVIYDGFRTLGSNRMSGRSRESIVARIARRQSAQRDAAGARRSVASFSAAVRTSKQSCAGSRSRPTSMASSVLPLVGRRGWMP